MLCNSAIGPLVMAVDDESHRVVAELIPVLQCWHGPISNNSSNNVVLNFAFENIFLIPVTYCLLVISIKSTRRYDTFFLGQFTFLEVTDIKRSIAQRMTTFCFSTVQNTCSITTPS